MKTRINRKAIQAAFGPSFFVSASRLPEVIKRFDKIRPVIVFFQTIEKHNSLMIGKAGRMEAIKPETITKEKQIEIYQEKIPAALYSFYADFLPENLKDDPAELDKYITDQSQNRFSAALMFICNTVFTNRKRLKYQAYKHLTPNYNNQSTEYDIDIIQAILDIYIYLCHRYDKDISVYGFHCLTGIEIESLYHWYRDYKNGNINSYVSVEVSRRRFEISKRLIQGREEALTGMLTGSKRNPVGIIAALNHLYGWNDAGRPEDSTSPAALSAINLPRLDSITSIDHAALPDNNGPDI